MSYLYKQNEIVLLADNPKAPAGVVLLDREGTSLLDFIYVEWGTGDRAWMKESEIVLKSLYLQFHPEVHIQDLQIGEAGYASPYAQSVDGNHNHIGLDTNWPCVSQYAYPYLLYVLRKEDGFYVGPCNADNRIPEILQKLPYMEKE